MHYSNGSSAQLGMFYFSYGRFFMTEEGSYQPRRQDIKGPARIPRGGNAGWSRIMLGEWSRLLR